MTKLPLIPGSFPYAIDLANHMAKETGKRRRIRSGFVDAHGYRGWVYASQPTDELITEYQKRKRKETS